MTPDDSPPPRMVPPYASARAAGPDWTLFGRLTAVVGVGVAIYLAFAFVAAPRFVQILHDFKVDLPAVTKLVLDLSLLVTQGGYVVLFPLSPVVALLAVQMTPHPDDEIVLARWRQRALRIALWIVIIAIIAVAATLIIPGIALINSVSGPQKR